MKAIIAHLIASSRGLSQATPIDVAIVDGNGAQVTSFGGSGGTSSSFASAFPSSGTAAGASDGVNMQPLLVDGSGNLKVSGSLSVGAVTSATSALTNVADSAASVTLLAANASRLIFEIVNDSTAVLFLKLGTTASATSYTKKLLPGESWSTADLGVNWIGKIDGIWASAPGGAARVTELTA